MQYLNPSETFGDIMVDYSYVECTSACITALCAFRSKYPGHRSAEISKSLKKGEKSWLLVIDVIGGGKGHDALSCCQRNTLPLLNLLLVPPAAPTLSSSPPPFPLVPPVHYSSSPGPPCSPSAYPPPAPLPLMPPAQLLKNNVIHLPLPTSPFHPPCS